MNELLDFYWNQMETLESDNHRYCYISYSDLERLEELMIKIGGDPNSLASQ